MGSAIEVVANLLGEDEAKKAADMLQKKGFKGAMLEMALMQYAQDRHGPSFAGAPPLPPEGTKPENRVVPVNMTPLAPTIPRPQGGQPAGGPPNPNRR